MHKGYTINYFIKFFSDIPVSKWHCGSLTNKDDLENGGCRSMKACALGYAGAYKVEEETHENFNGHTYKEYYETGATTPNRENALLDLLPTTADINDNSSGYYNSLGKTPRARILKALKLRKKLGPNWEDNF